MLEFQHTAARRRLALDTQVGGPHYKFQLTAARRRLADDARDCKDIPLVSTHSRLKAAGYFGLWHILFGFVSTHSRLKAAGLMC